MTRLTACFALVLALLTASSLPLFAQARTTPVEVKNTATVKTPTQSTLVQLFATDQTIAPSGTVQSSVIPCEGYREIRVVVSSDCSQSYMRVRLMFQSPIAGVGISPGYATFGTTAVGITDQSGFKTLPTTCAFTAPVMSGSCWLVIEHTGSSSSGSFTIQKESWAYLVN